MGGGGGVRLTQLNINAFLFEAGRAMHDLLIHSKHDAQTFGCVCVCVCVCVRVCAHARACVCFARVVKYIILTQQ